MNVRKNIVIGAAVLVTAFVFCAKGLCAGTGYAANENFLGDKACINQTCDGQKGSSVKGVMPENMAKKNSSYALAVPDDNSCNFFCVLKESIDYAVQRYKLHRAALEFYKFRKYSNAVSFVDSSFFGLSVKALGCGVYSPDGKTVLPNFEKVISGEGGPISGVKSYEMYPDGAIVVSELDHDDVRKDVVRYQVVFPDGKTMAGACEGVFNQFGKGACKEIKNFVSADEAREKIKEASMKCADRVIGNGLVQTDPSKFEGYGGPTSENSKQKARERIKAFIQQIKLNPLSIDIK